MDRCPDNVGMRFIRHVGLFASNNHNQPVRSLFPQLQAPRTTEAHNMAERSPHHTSYLTSMLFVLCVFC